MFVTTAYRVTETMLNKAKGVAIDLDIPFYTRGKKSISRMQEERGTGCIVAGNETLKLFGFGEDAPFFFHPSSAMFRVKRLIEGGSDPLIEAAGLERGHSFLDCTLGLASDSIVASFVTGKEGMVTGIEGNQYVAYLVKKGLLSWTTSVAPLDEAMSRVQVVNSNSLSLLKSLPDNSVDCVYWDPMFEESIDESEGIRSLRQFALYEGLGEEEIIESLRVSRNRVVLKDHFKSTRFDEFGFRRAIRKAAKFHYGYLEKK
ncbi:hypothetical protein AM500_10630 [Bacillus sp. FJAT-18017]|uniref:class I SAM-dependent methyltransferase n=1 Tax=Bacillus sp. FJAT-18017 TaxID=1705566 RepID=UPI0006B026E3|nr:class I SAM-dependent methyltransferase [Bacillus sp. FJAT-18017]ALC90187.1 hypothetical protein AM500_10630 [Bacillus sp. FJAT-18017]